LERTFSSVAVHPALEKGLAKLGYDRADIRAVRAHLAGYRSLIGAPGINHALLREKRLHRRSPEPPEDYLPRVNHIRLAFTPWVLGKAFCLDVLGVPEKDMTKPTFDLLRFLGFSAQDVTVANAFCCGRPSVKGSLEIAETHLRVFALRDDLRPEAQIRMAASVQSFIMGDVALSLSVPSTLPAQVRGQLLLMGWEQGLRSLTLHQTDRL
jgi:ribonucleoside-diphosphate reductase alpha chain